MYNRAGRFAARWGVLLFSIVTGAVVLLLVASLVIGNNLDRPDLSAPAVISSEGRFPLAVSSKSCPEEINSCYTVSVQAGEVVTVANITDSLGITPMNGQAPVSVTRVSDGWAITLPDSDSTILISASNYLWVLSAS